MLVAHLPLILFSIDPHFMLVTPWRCKILSLPIRNKVWACLATQLNIQKKVVQLIVRLDEPITQYGRVFGLDGGDRMVGRHFVKESEDSRDASFVRVRPAFFPFLMCKFWASPLVYPTCRSTCSPSQKNTGLRVPKFLRPTKPYSSYRVTISTTTKLRWANNRHCSANSRSQNNIKERHLLLQEFWCWRGCWSEYTTVCCWKGMG